jgi:hypothetical protein
MVQIPRFFLFSLFDPLLFKISFYCPSPKSYSDGEIVKECLSIFVENSGNPKTKLLSKNFALSRNTVTQRIEEMAIDV